MSSLHAAALAVPKGSLVLVTGANGLVGSHIVDQYLYYGYRVRGTARDTEKNAWLVDFFRARYGKDSFELFKVPDMNAEGAYDDAVKGVSVFAHSASVVNLDHDPNNVIPPTIAGAVNALKVAYSEPSVKRFVLTSSSTAIVSIADGRAGVTASETTWNEESVKAAWAPPPYTPERAWEVYGASKTQAEQEVLKYHEEHRRERPDLVVNTVLPSTNLGHPVAPAHQGYPSSSALPLLLWKGEVSDALKASPTQFFVDTADNGRLHVAAGILENVKDRRILGLGGRWTLDRILEILRSLEPGKVFPENFSGDQDPNEIEGLDRSEQLLRDLGRRGWTTLEESIGGLVEDLRKSDP